ncbi:MAG: phage terminase large subunit [Nitrosomonadaceae bacterium]
MSLSLMKKLDALEPQIQARAGKLEPSVYGVVDKVDKIDGKLVPHCVRKWKGTIGSMIETDEEPTIFLIEKLEPFILKHKKYKCAFGGRGGTKSRMAQDCVVGEVNSVGSKVFVMRERMKSLEQSIYAGIEKSIKDMDVTGFTSVPSKWRINHKTGGIMQFGGLQNVIDMKGASSFKIFLMEEAARTKLQTIDTLGPTLRGIDGAELWWLWNNESSTDPMSQEFIVPYQAEIDRSGFYEDEYHLIIKVGYQDNPWFEHDESLRGELKKDTEKMRDGRMSKSRFNHIWNGEFNDDIDTSVITSDWFEACIDAHKKLGFQLKGGKVATCDPSDVGKDPTGYSERQGVIFTGVTEIEGENGNIKFDITCRKALEYGADIFGWDCDGMGALLRNQAVANFKGTKVKTFMYKGSESVHHPDAMVKYENTTVNLSGNKTNKDTFANKKAQNIISFAERVYKTYEAVVMGIYHDPDTLVSFCSEGISKEMMQKLKAEACKLPLRPGTDIRFYTKDEMRKGITMPDGHKVVIPSPNLLDACVLSFDHASNITETVAAYIPGRLNSMGAGKRR